MSENLSTSGQTSGEGTWQVIAARYGAWPTTRSSLFFDWGLYREADGPQALDFYFWVLRQGERTILVDTGFSPAQAEARGRDLAWDPHEALRALAPEPELIVLTHLHYDHTGGLPLYPEVPVLLSAAEAEFWRSEIAGRVQFLSHAAPDDLELISGRLDRGTAGTIEPGTEIVPGVTAIGLPGHTPGQIGLEVRTASGTVLLTSDAVHLDEELRREMPFRLVTDLEALYESFQIIKQAERDGAIVVPGHEPDVIERFPPLPGFEGRACLIA